MPDPSPPPGFLRHLLLAALLLAGCGAQIPKNIRQAPPNNPSLAQVRDSPIAEQVWQVRWGGKILETENREHETRFIVLSQPLSRRGEPQDSDRSDGRFIAIVPVFLDPKLYRPDRQLTVSGTVREFEKHKVGEYDYRYPVVLADSYYLWPEVAVAPYGYPYPGWYDPWYYDPWFYSPWYPYRYRYW